MATHEVMPQDLPAKRRTWKPPAPPPQGRAPIPAARSIELQSPPGSVGEYVGRTLGYTVIFGVLGIFFQSRFPLALGAFLFVADEKFIQWAMAKVGIRFVPDTLWAGVHRCFRVFRGIMGADHYLERFCASLVTASCGLPMASDQHRGPRMCRSEHTVDDGREKAAAAVRY